MGIEAMNKIIQTFTDQPLEEDTVWSDECATVTCHRGSAHGKYTFTFELRQSAIWESTVSIQTSRTRRALEGMA